MPQSESPKNFSVLIEDLKNDTAFFNRIGPALALLKPGNWTGLIELARFYGYAVQQSDVLQYVSELAVRQMSAVAGNAYLTSWLTSVPALKKAVEAQ